MKPTSVILYLHAETSLHPGAGRSLGAIDLPVQREGHTDHPVVLGSSLKGALRERASGVLSDDVLAEVYGPPPIGDGPSEFGGALSVGDARILLLPVRSLTSTFRWVTAPGPLSSWLRTARRLGVGLPELRTPAVASSNAALALEGETLYLEDHLVEASADSAGLAPWVSVLSQALHPLERAALGSRLAVVHDDLFTHLAKYTLPVDAHVRLNERKTVVQGQLWYEETLPPETVLFAPLVGSASRKRAATLGAAAILSAATGVFETSPYLQIGGNESTGQGWCHVSWSSDVEVTRSEVLS